MNLLPPAPMYAVAVGSLLAALVAGLAKLLVRREPEEPMLPEPDTDWTD